MKRQEIPYNFRIHFSLGVSDPYAFTLGAQCQITGNAATCYATADIKECRVYDSALSETNVKRLVEGEEAIAEESGTYITSVTSVDTAALDLLATDVNTVDVIMNETLPKTTKATLSNGTEINVNILWYMVSETEINGFISTPYAKTEQLILEAEYGYTVRFDYDETLVSRFANQIGRKRLYARYSHRFGIA